MAEKNRYASSKTYKNFSRFTDGNRSEKIGWRKLIGSYSLNLKPRILATNHKGGRKWCASLTTIGRMESYGSLNFVLRIQVNPHWSTGTGGARVSKIIWSEISICVSALKHETAFISWSMTSNPSSGASPLGYKPKPRRRGREGEG